MERKTTHNREAFCTLMDEYSFATSTTQFVRLVVTSVSIRVTVGVMLAFVKAVMSWVEGQKKERAETVLVWAESSRCDREKRGFTN